MALLFTAFTAKAYWFDGFIDGIANFTKPETNLTIIQNNSIVATSQIEIQISKYAAKYPTTTQRKILYTDWNPWSAGQCVGWVRAVTGVDFSGNAINWDRYVNSQVPEIDTIVVLKINDYLGHIGLVIEYDENTITMRSRNYRGLWIVSDDILDKEDIKIVGYIKI